MAIHANPRLPPWLPLHAGSGIPPDDKEAVDVALRTQTLRPVSEGRVMSVQDVQELAPNT
jgi:hypothetical protein